MQPSLIGLYFTIIILIGMIWYAGLEGTMRVFTYIELTTKYQFIKIQMYFMRRKLERQLGITNKP